MLSRHLVTHLKRMLGRLFGPRYEPSRHYMRGPGPATRARRALERKGTGSLP
jgi:hypothetical protein